MPQPLATPCASCVLLFDLGDGRRMLLSYTAAGTERERWIGPEEDCTDAKMDEMAANLTRPRRFLALA